MPFFREKKLLTPPIARAAYSDRTAWIMSELSRIAYLRFEQDLAPLDQALSFGGFVSVKTFDKNGTQAFIARRADMVALVFRGTEGKLEDITTDLKARLIKSKAGKVHNGFNLAYESVKDEIRAAIEQITDVPIYITGHSLGAALATLATFDLNRDNLAACYTFGSPRVGDKSLDWKIKIPVYRVVNSTDIVANVPLMAMKYQHVGSLFYLNAEGDLIRSPAGIRLLGRWFKVVAQKLFQTVHDHFILDYCEKLRKIALKRNN